MVGPGSTPVGLIVAAIGSCNEIAEVGVDALYMRGL
jgi:hypothetical protein